MKMVGSRIRTKEQNREFVLLDFIVSTLDEFVFALMMFEYVGVGLIACRNADFRSAVWDCITFRDPLAIGIWQKHTWVPLVILGLWAVTFSFFPQLANWLMPN